MRPIRRTLVYPHPIEFVWRAISEREALSAWLMETDFEPVVGRPFTFRTDPAPGFDGVVRGEVLVVEPPRRLVYSWRGGPLKETRVSFTLAEVPGGTRLTLEHGGFSGLGGLVPRFVLGFGWRDLLGRDLPAWLDRGVVGSATSPRVEAGP